MRSTQLKTVPFKVKQILNQQITGLRDVFSTIIADEMVTDKGLIRLSHFYKQNRIPREALKFVRDEAFCQAAHFEMIDQGSSQDTYWVLHLAKRLGISQRLLDWMEEEISTLTILNHIQNCEFEDVPDVQPKSVTLEIGERAFAELPAMLIKESAINKKHETGLTGISFRLARGIQYRIGEKKSELLVRSGMSQMDAGKLLITNKRLIYSGTKGSCSVDIGTLFGTRIFADSIQFATIKDEKVVTIGFQDPMETEYCGVVISKVLNS